MSAPLTVQHQFADIDALAEVSRAWDVDFRQLDPGPFRGSVVQWITPAVQLAGATFSRRVDQRGAPPRRLRSVAMAARPDVRFFWRGHHVTANDLLIFPLGGEIECVSAPGFANLVLSVDEEVLEGAAERMGQAGVSRTLRSREVLALPAEVMGRLRRDLAQLFEAGLHRPHASVSRLQTEAPRALVKALGSVAEHECGLHGTRVRVVREAIALARDHSGSGLSVTELASLLGVTERSLQRGFRDVVGTTPKAYIQAQRLTAVRRQLRTADASRIRVADVANECGFWHLGQFAADYRRHFGERPSDTLRRGRAR